MDQAWQELIRAAPWGAVILGLEWMKLQASERAQKERDTNAKEKAQADRESAQVVAKAYADAINTLAKSIIDQTARIESAIVDMKTTVTKQYDSMGITQELLEMAKMRIQKGDVGND